MYICPSVILAKRKKKGGGEEQAIIGLCICQIALVFVLYFCHQLRVNDFGKLDYVTPTVRYKRRQKFRIVAIGAHLQSHSTVDARRQIAVPCVRCVTGVVLQDDVAQPLAAP